LPLIAEDPRYTAALRKSGGLVELRVLVDENGRVADVKALQGDRALVDSAIKAVRLWRYTPAVKQGVKVKVWLIVPIRFVPPR
jgi:protein TonB